MDKELIYAYLAGVLDSDGCISIAKVKARRRHCPGYQEKLDVGQVNAAAVLLFKQTFGGSIYHIDRPPPRRPIWGWRASSLIAAEVIRCLRPYLRLKGDQADVLIDLRKDIDRQRPSQVNHVLGTPHTPVAVSDYRESLHQRVKALHWKVA